MCGIAAYIGEKCVENLLDALKQLQNRGYDSAGICKIVNQKFNVYKYASTPTQNAIDKLETTVFQDADIMTEQISVGISHNRWSTHGPKTDYNAHPHCSMDGKFSIVHNGIIENYKTIKEKLVADGYIFQSLTDSEVIANLLSYEYTHSSNKDIIQTIQRTFKQLQGTWGVAMLSLDYPDHIFCIRHGSPLLVSANENFAMIVSEQSGFCGKVENYYVLKNHDLCIVKRVKGKIEMITNEIYEEKKVNLLDPTENVNPYPYWTIKEILEQDETSLRAIGNGGRIDKNERVKLGGLDDSKKILKKVKNLILLGCGTSYHAGMLATHYFKDLCSFNTVQCIDAAEFSEKDIPLIGNTAFILLSQSGETKDLYNCLEVGKQNNVFLIGVINVVDSMIAREVNCGCYLNAGREVAVASTKSFTSQVIVLSMIAIWFAQLNGLNLEKRKYYIADLRKLCIDIKNTLNASNQLIPQFLPLFKDKNSCFVLGKGKAEATAIEGALKIKELTKIHAEGYSISSLKHGPFALLENDFPVVLIAPNNADFTKADNAYNEILSRNAKILFITDNPNSNNTHTLLIPNNTTYSELLSVIPLQLLSYYLSIEKGMNPDMPGNLAKVVTVE